MHSSLLFPFALLLLPATPVSSAAGTTPNGRIPLHALDSAPVLHFTLARRGGVINTTALNEDFVNLPNLLHSLEQAEARFNLTKREVKGNKLVRKAKDVSGSGGEGVLMGEVAADGVWYANISIGSPPQQIEMDLNMLVSDFYVLTTSGRVGSRFDEYFSQSYVHTNKHPYPTCGLPTDVFHLPTTGKAVTLDFTHCRPSKASLKSLSASGSILGLAPSEYLSQTRSTSILRQMFEKDAIQRPIFSLMLINGHEGVLSIGGTAAPAVEMVDSLTKFQLDRLGMIERGEISPDEMTESASLLTPSIPSSHEIDDTNRLVKRGRPHKEVAPRQAGWEEGWAWTKVQGAEGWWQILMQSVHVDGVKVLQNQAVVMDVNSPFILAPPVAAKAFYASISGSRSLPPPDVSTLSPA